MPDDHVDVELDQGDSGSLECLTRVLYVKREALSKRRPGVLLPLVIMAYTGEPAAPASWGGKSLGRGGTRIRARMRIRPFAGSHARDGVALVWSLRSTGLVARTGVVQAVDILGA